MSHDTQYGSGHTHCSKMFEVENSAAKVELERQKSLLKDLENDLTILLEEKELTLGAYKGAMRLASDRHIPQNTSHTREL